MVQKTSYRGVLSGNTLRASNSRYSRRYHHQACIVSRAHPELLQKMIERESAGSRPRPDSSNGERIRKPDDLTLEPPRNFSVDVALSLNKQARWLLPTALIQQIRSNDFEDSGLKVSLLERHKLKKQASCVSFHSNKGQVRRVMPKSGRYFGFVYPRTDGKTMKTLRKERRDKLLETQRREKKRLQQALKKCGLQLSEKTVVVYTEMGRRPVGNTRAEDDPGQDMLGDSEVRHEVYYPSPASSSLSHNPKYIMQDADVVPGDGHEHAKHGKPRKRHRARRRQRMSLKDIDDWALQHCPSPSGPQRHQTLETVAHPHTDDPEASSSPFDDDVREERSTSECLMSSLLEKAQRLQRFKGAAAKPRGKKIATRTQADTDEKPHIVYLSGEGQGPYGSHENLSPNREESNAPSPTVVPAPSPSIPSECTRVLLAKDDVSVASLKECFGESYSEVGCIPRKFILDVSGSVQQLLKKNGNKARVAKQPKDTLSYLICVHDGFYDDDHDVYRVLLNSKLHAGLLSVELGAHDQPGLFRGTVMTLISLTMDFVHGLLTSLREEECFLPFIHDQTGKFSQTRFLKHLGSSSEVYTPSVTRMLQLDCTGSEVILPVLSDMVNEDPVFCDVCYGDISPLTQGSAPYTALPSCRHRVCDDCWAQHVHSRLQQGFVRVTCPGYDCQQDVGAGLLLSLAPVDTAQKLLFRQEEIRIGASLTEKWCPNPPCGRVLSLQSSAPGGGQELSQDVLCACGTHVCFRCLMPAHWPASCQQAEDYRATVATAVFPDRLAEIHDDLELDELARVRQRQQEQKEVEQIMLVEGKRCPRCRSFVNKNGGCAQMQCPCGQMFCWYCARPGSSHSLGQCVSHLGEVDRTTTLVVRHVEHGDQDQPGDKRQQRQSPPPSAGSRRQRTSLVERAVEHANRRKASQHNARAIATLTKAVASAVAKNKALAQHLTGLCCSGPAPEPGASVTVPEMTSAFLRSVDRSRQELLEVVEYSLVLLKDLPDTLLRRRALRITDDLSAFCIFWQSTLDAWSSPQSRKAPLQDAVKAVTRLAEIQGWVDRALRSHVVTVKKLRGLCFPQSQ